MKKILWPAATLMGPVPPVLVSCGSMEKPAMLTVAWTGIINSEPPMTYVSIRPSRYSHNIIKESGEFVINLMTKDFVWAVDYCGTTSGAQTDKFKKTLLTPAVCEHVVAPQIEQAAISLECKVRSVTCFETHDMFLAEIVGVYVNDSYLEGPAKLNLSKAGLLAYINGSYHLLGRKIGTYGFSAHPKKTKKKVITQKKRQTKKQMENKNDHD